MTSVRLSRLALAGSLYVALAACDRGPTDPSRSNGLELAVHVVGFDSHSAGPPSFTTVIRNRSVETVTVVFGNACAIRRYIDDARGGNVYPGTNGMGCLEAVIEVTLPPGESTLTTMPLEPGAKATMTGSKVILPPGRYVAHAEVEGFIGDFHGDRVKMRARAVSFRVP